MSSETQSATGSVTVDVTVADQAFARETRAFYIGGAGDLAVTMEEGMDQTFLDLPQGFVLTVKASAVLNTGTTATNVVALF